MDIPPLGFEPRSIEVVAPESARNVSLMADHPYVLKGLMDNWAVLAELRAASDTRAKLERLGRFLGDRAIPYSVVPELGSGLDEKFRIAVGRVERDPFPAFADRITRIHGEALPEIIYSQSMPLRKYPALASGCGVIEPLNGTDVFMSGVWIGSGRQITNLHIDPFVNFICMIEGRKRVTVLPPEAMADLYPAPVDRWPFGACMSLVKLRSLDLDKYPRVKRALEAAQVAVLEPGDVLMLPPCWWHHVESFGFNVMVNTWAHRTNGQTARQFLKALHPMFGLRDALLALDELSDAARLEERAWFAERLSASAPDAGRPSGTPWSDRAADTRNAPRSRAVLARIAEDLAAAPPCLKDLVRMHYEYYVFRTHGDPYPTLPGEHSAMVRRLRRPSLSRLAQRLAFMLMVRSRRLDASTGLAA